MKPKSHRILHLFLLLVSITGIARADNDHSLTSVLAKAAETGRANKFLTAVYLAELLETLRDDGPFTVFVPIDSAFDRIPSADLRSLYQPENTSKLAKILKYHVVNERIPASRITNKPRVKTIEGRSLTIAANSKGVAVDGATIVETDIIGRNGIVHLIDRVLMPASEDILETARKAGNFQILIKALELTGLDQALTSDGPFTVFAPTDQAFAKLGKQTLEDLIADKNKLTEILKYHVLPGAFLSDELLANHLPNTLIGKPLRFSASSSKGLLVNGISVASKDLKVANGVIQVIDGVLLPSTSRNLVTTAEQAGQFNALLKALDVAGLTDTLREKGPFTVLAPTDEAFAKLGHRSIAALLKDKEKLAELLKLHVIPGKIKARDLAAGAELKTLAGETLQSSIKKGRLVVNEANVIDTDIDAGNGIVHVISRVLIPSKSSH